MILKELCFVTFWKSLAVAREITVSLGQRGALTLWSCESCMQTNGESIHGV